MPEMDGTTLVSQMRADPSLQHVPVCTSLPWEGRGSTGSMGLSPDDYVTKPFRFDDPESG